MTCLEDGFSVALPRLKTRWNQLNFLGDVEGSQSMIISCCCSWRTNYPLEISGPQEVLKSCKICGSSRRSVKDCLSLPLNMVGTIGREHSGALARNITWVISTKNNLRAPRRRKAFPLSNGKDITESSWKVSEDFTSKDSKNGEMSVMESEKLGVTILGRRFGDHIQQVPIKKRRFLQLQPTSSPSSLCFPEQIHCLSSCKNGKMQDLNEKKSIQGLNLHNTRIDGDLYRTMAHTSNLLEDHGEPGEGADFSGISILAAAACGSGLADNDVISSLEQEHEVSESNIQKYEPNSVSKHMFVVQSLDATGCAAVLSTSEVATSELSNDGDRTKIGEIDVIEQHLNDCSKMLVGSSDTLPASSLREEKFCWDLNKAIDDAWEDSELDFVESQDPSAYDSIKNNVHAAEFGKQGAFQGCDGGVQCPLKLHKDTYLDGKLKDGEMCNVADGSANQLLSRDCNNAIDCGSESQVCADDSFQSNCHFADDGFKVVGEREVSSNADDSLASGVISPDDFMVSSFNAPVADAEGLHVGKVSSLHVVEWSQKAGFPINSLVGARASGILVDSSNSEKVFCSSNGCVVDGQSETVSKTTTLCVSETIIESPHKPESPLVSQDMNIQESGGSTDLSVQVESFTELKDNPVQCSAVDTNPNTVIDCLRNELKDSVIESDSAVWAGTKEGLEDVDATVNTFEEYAPERHAGWCSTSFHNDREQQIEPEKVEIQEDDDSQYEDGEFRVSHDWGIDGCDEEAEHVDYGSDDKDTIAAESSPDHFTSTGAPHLDAVGLKLQKPFVQEDSRVDDGSQVPKCLIDTGLRHFRNSNVETGKRTGVLDRVRRTCNSRDGAEELSRSTFLKLKSSGWDQLPERSRQNKNAAGDDRSAGSRKTRTGSPDGYCSIEGSRVGGRKQRMDPSSRLDRFNCSEISRKEDAGYFWRKREYPDDPDHTFERNEGRATAVRKDESSACTREKGGRIGEYRDASWTKSQHKFSPGHYSSRFSQSKLKNAAASSLKGVSNGFGASHDETVVGPPDFEFNNRAIRRSITASVQDVQHPPKERRSPTRRDEELNFDRPTDIGLLRDTSPTRRGNTPCGRPGRYEPRIITTGHGHGYLGPISGDDIDSMLPTQQSFSRNDRKFSPRRGSVHIPKAQTRSRSRSRTRSPHPWRSPRRKNDIEMNGSRRWSRSPPNFRTARGERTRIPLQRPAFFDEMMDFAPSRNRGSPPLPSRWIDERKDLRCHSREHEYRCSAGRSPSERFFSHDRKIFAENERLKSEEYRQSSNAGRFREFAIEKRPRFDGLTDRRGYENRYRRFTSPSGQHDIVGDDKHPSYDDHASFRPRISRHRVGQEFDDRGSPRELNGDPEKQMGGLPCRPRNDGSHHFRYSRDVRQDRSFRSFEIRECDDDMTIRRRLP